MALMKFRKNEPVKLVIGYFDIFEEKTFEMHAYRVARYNYNWLESLLIAAGARLMYKQNPSSYTKGNIYEFEVTRISLTRYRFRTQRVTTPSDFSV